MSQLLHIFSFLPWFFTRGFSFSFVTKNSYLGYLNCILLYCYKTFNRQSAQIYKINTWKSLLVFHCVRSLINRTKWFFCSYEMSYKPLPTSGGNNRNMPNLNIIIQSISNHLLKKGGAKKNRIE